MTRSGAEAVEMGARRSSEATIEPGLIDDVTVGAVPHRGRELDAVPGLVDGSGGSWTLEAASLTSNTALEAALTLAGAGARVICGRLGG